MKELFCNFHKYQKVVFTFFNKPYLLELKNQFSVFLVIKTLFIMALAFYFQKMITYFTNTMSFHEAIEKV